MNTFLFTPSFCKWELLQNLMDHLYYNKKVRATHVLIDNHYPVEKEKNSRAIKSISDLYGCVYVDSEKDLGLHDGINNAAKVVGMKPGDIMIVCDPDDRPDDGFIELMTHHMTTNKKLAILGCSFSIINERFKQGILKEQDGLWIHPSIEMWNVNAFSTELFFDIGGLSEPNKYYGGVESHVYPKFKAKGMQLAYLPECKSDRVFVDRNDRRLFDPEYREWKCAHISGDQRSFEEFYNAKQAN